MRNRKSPAELLLAVKPHLKTEDYEDLQYYLWNGQMDFAKGIRQYDHIDWLKSRIAKINEILSEAAPYAYEDERADKGIAEEMFFPMRSRELLNTQPDPAEIEKRIDGMRARPKHIWEDGDAR